MIKPYEIEVEGVCPGDLLLRGKRLHRVVSLEDHTSHVLLRLDGQYQPLRVPAGGLVRLVYSQAEVARLEGIRLAEEEAE